MTESGPAPSIGDVVRDAAPAALGVLLRRGERFAEADAIPLTLRAVGGLTTHEIADGLLQSEATIAQPISRAKATIARSDQPFRQPTPDLVDDQLASVMQVIYLVFTEGHAPAGGSDPARTDLATEAIRLARQLHNRLPDTPEVAGLLALMLLTDARRAARTNPDGELVPLDQQDRALWNRNQITAGLTLLTSALASVRHRRQAPSSALSRVRIECRLHLLRCERDRPTAPSTPWHRRRDRRSPGGLARSRRPSTTSPLAEATPPHAGP